MMISVYARVNQVKKKKEMICMPCCESQSFEEVISTQLLDRNLVVGDGDSDGDIDVHSNSDDVSDQASDGRGDVPSFTNPEDPLVSDENLGSSPPSSTL